MGVCISLGLLSLKHVNIICTRVYDGNISIVTCIHAVHIMVPTTEL